MLRVNKCKYHQVRPLREFIDAHNPMMYPSFSKASLNQQMPLRQQHRIDKGLYCHDQYPHPSLETLVQGTLPIQRAAELAQCMSR
jgi:hypothetical protein